MLSWNLPAHETVDTGTDNRCPSAAARVDADLGPSSVEQVNELGNQVSFLTLIGCRVWVQRWYLADWLNTLMG